MQGQETRETHCRGRIHGKTHWRGRIQGKPIARRRIKANKQKSRSKCVRVTRREKEAKFKGGGRVGEGVKKGVRETIRKVKGGGRGTGGDPLYSLIRESSAKANICCCCLLPFLGSLLYNEVRSIAGSQAQTRPLRPIYRLTPGRLVKKTSRLGPP